MAVRHLDWCLALAQEHDPLSAGPRRSLRTLETEHDNLRAGLTFALRRDPQAALRLATSLWRFWLDRGYFAEGSRWLEATLVAAARAHRAARGGPAGERRALAAQRQLRPSYLHRVQAAVADYRELGDEHATAAALYQHAMLEQSVSNTARADGALRRRGRHRPPPRRPAPAGGRHPRVGHDAVVPRRPRAGRARRCARRSRSSRLSPTTTRRSSTSVTFGLCLLHDGPQGARACTSRRRSSLFHRFARAQAIGYALNNLAWTARATGDTAQATAALDEALERFRAVEDRAGEALTLNHMGNLARVAGRPRRRPRPRARGARAAPPARREARDLREHAGAGDDRDGSGDVARGHELLGEAFARAEAVDDLPAMAGVQTEWGLAEERRGELEQRRSRSWTPDASCGACSSCGASRAGRRSRCATCASASATGRARSSALEAARELLLDSEDAAAERYLATKAPLSECKDARVRSLSTHPTPMQENHMTTMQHAGRRRDRRAARGDPRHRVRPRRRGLRRRRARSGTRCSTTSHPALVVRCAGTADVIARHRARAQRGPRDRRPRRLALDPRLLDHRGASSSTCR